MDFSWELLFELLGKVADTIGNVLGGTKKIEKNENRR